MLTSFGIVGDVAAADSIGYILLVAALDLVVEVGMVPVVSRIPPGCASVYSVMSSVENAATAVWDSAVWIVADGSAIVRGETASVLEERAVVGVHSSSILTCRWTVFVCSLRSVPLPFHSHAPWRYSSGCTTDCDSLGLALNVAPMFLVNLLVGQEDKTVSQAKKLHSRAVTCALNYQNFQSSLTSLLRPRPVYDNAEQASRLKSKPCAVRATAILTIIARVDDFVFAEQIPEVTAAVNDVQKLVVILQPQQKLYNIAAPNDSVARTCAIRNVAATNTKVWHNWKCSANVGGRVVFFGNGQAAMWIHGDGEARFHLEQHLSVSHLDLLANAHGSQFEPQV